MQVIYTYTYIYVHICMYMALSDLLPCPKPALFSLTPKLTFPKLHTADMSAV